MDYTKASDFEINTAIANKQGINWQVCASDGDEIYRVVGGDGLNYCTNWEDMGPLIVEYHISVFSFITHWRCNSIMSKSTRFYIDDKNPLRAAAIVYLMMDGA